jgi:MOSC domain-containing protein YiiM
MYTVGPYTFTEHDAQRTVAAHDTVWQLLAEGRDATALAPLEPTLTGELEHDLHAVWDAWQAAGPALRAAGQLPATATGVVEGLHVSNGGLPKTPVLHATVGWRGVEGDRQATRQHHGRPFQALCLWSGEVIDAFRAQGHPLAPGLAGENITVRGLTWSDVRPGVLLHVGTVRCSISSYAIPCSQNRGWFVDGEFDLMHHRHGPVSRVYATVLEPGEIAIGDTVVLEP